MALRALGTNISRRIRPSLVKPSIDSSLFKLSHIDCSFDACAIVCKSAIVSPTQGARSRVSQENLSWGFSNAFVRFIKSSTICISPILSISFDSQLISFLSSSGIMELKCLRFRTSMAMLSVGDLFLRFLILLMTTKASAFFASDLLFLS